MKPFNKILLVNLVVSVAVGIVSFIVFHSFPRNSDPPLWILISSVTLIILQSIVCWVIAIVLLIKKKTNPGLGFLLSGVLVFVVGFGTCSAMMFQF